MSLLSPTPSSTHGDGQSDGALASSGGTQHPQPEGETSPSDHPLPAQNAPTRRLRRAVPIGIAALLLAGAAAAFFLVGGDEAADEPAAAPRRAVTAETRDLIEYEELSGTLGFASTGTLAASTQGVITRVAEAGVSLGRGDVAYELNGEPVVVFYGEAPFYRPLAEGDEGDDVLILEENLAALGHHATEDADGNQTDEGFVVDGVFDGATAEAVLRWQAELGRAETGVIEAGDVVVVAGPSEVTTVSAERGATVQTAGPVLSVTLGSSISTFHAAHSGEVELVAAPGTTIAPGDVVYTVDEFPVVAMVIPDDDSTTITRDLGEGVTDGADVEVLEQTLAGLGYDAGGDLEVDETFDQFTTEALGDWQEDLADIFDDYPTDEVLDVEDIVVVRPDTVVGSIVEYDSDTIATGSVLFTSGTGEAERVVTTSIEVARQEQLALGTVVDVEFPDSTVTTGTVTHVASESTTDPTDPEAEAELAVEISVNEVPENIENLFEVDVTVLLVDELVVAATVVPVSALVATGDGGYAVEVVGDAGTQFMAVTPGMFADGFVEVTGIEPGTAVVVPS